MASRFQKLTSTQEKTGVPWQTIRLNNFPGSISGLARVVAAIEQHFLSDQWETEVVRGSIRIRHKTLGQRLVRVFVDDDNRLARRNNLYLNGEPIVVGMDLTDYSAFERYVIREFLRSHFHYYVDPEANGEKIAVMADYGHWLDVLFIPEGACDFAVDEQRVEELMVKMGEEDRSPPEVTA